MEMINLSPTQELLLGPGKCLESMIYDRHKQFPLKQLICRIGALVAPLFHAVGMITSTVALTASIVLMILNRTDSSLYAIASLDLILANGLWLISSILEIPHKLLTGFYNPPNYLGDFFRYDWGLQIGYFLHPKQLRPDQLHFPDDWYAL